MGEIICWFVDGIGSGPVPENPLESYSAPFHNSGEQFRRANRCSIRRATSASFDYRPAAARYPPDWFPFSPLGGWYSEAYQCERE